MRHTVVLMYHALWQSPEQLQAIDPEDRPYALHVEDFRAQLDALQRIGARVLDPVELEQSRAVQSGVVLSFDDGHRSNAELALPLLIERGMKALFFITTGFTGVRAAYCTGTQLRELHRAGMRLGGHGQTHRFLSDLSDADLRQELVGSRRSLAEALGEEPRQMSMPGGRCSERVIRAAHDAGWQVLHGSRVGSLAAGRSPRGTVLPRVALRAGMPLPMFEAYARADAAVMLRASTAAAAKAGLRHLLGNERYHRLYARLKG